MSNSEERRFLLSVFNFVFKSNKKELPSIFTETFPHVDISSEDAHLTPVLCQGISNVIETQNVASTRVSVEDAADYWRRLVMDSYSEETLLNFICFHARNCLLGNLDASEMIDEFELVMNVIKDAKISEKFTEESWEKLNAAAALSTKDAEERREAEFNRLHRGSSRSSTPEKPYEPAAKKQRTDLPITSSSVEMSEAGPSSVTSEKPEISQGTGGKAKGKVEKSVMLPEKEVGSPLKKTEASGNLPSGDDESDTKKLKELKISREIAEKEMSKKTIETEMECEETEHVMCEEVGSLPSKNNSEESQDLGTVKIEITLAKECQPTQTTPEEPEMMQESKGESAVEMMEESGTMQKTEDSA